MNNDSKQLISAGYSKAPTQVLTPRVKANMLTYLVMLSPSLISTVVNSFLALKDSFSHSDSSNQNNHNYYSKGIQGPSHYIRLGAYPSASNMSYFNGGLHY